MTFAPNGHHVLSSSTPPRRNEVTPVIQRRNGYFSPTLDTSSSSSGPSSIDSQQQQYHPRQRQQQAATLPGQAKSNHVFDETLVVIEKSNQELEMKLGGGARSPTSPRLTPKRPENGGPGPVLRSTPAGRGPTRVDTIHNHSNLLSQEIIYEIEPDPVPVSKPSPADSEVTTGSSSLSRSSSQSTIKAASGSDGLTVSDKASAAPSYPSLSDLSLQDIDMEQTAFKSLTAQKLMAGLSFNSIDTLLEVNAVAEARGQMDESTETIDFGVI